MASIDERPRDLRWLGLSALSLGAVWLIVSVYAVHAALPSNPISLPFENQISVRSWLPQGWGLFTKDPRQERMFMFGRQDDGRWNSLSLAPLARASNAFGLNRASRAQGVEADRLFVKLANKDWRACQDEPVRCLEMASVVATLHNVSPRPTLCGDVGLVLQPPVPWAWSRSGSKIVMPSRVARLKVGC